MNYATKGGLVAIIALIGLGCVWFGLAHRSGQPESKDSIIKIGVIGPLTGPLATYGVAHKQGFGLAAKDFDAAGRHVEFVYEDSQYDTAKAVSAFQKLVSVDHVSAVVDWGAATSFGIAPLAKPAGVPFIAMSVDPDTVKASDYVFRDNPSPDDIAGALWGYFREKGYKHIALVNLKLLYFDKITEALKRNARADESVTVIDTYQSFSDSNFRTSIVKIKNAGAQYDTVGVFLIESQILPFYSQATELGLHTPTFGTDFFESRSLIVSAHGMMDGAVYVLMGATDDFATHYASAYGNDDQISYAGLSYDLAHMLIDNTNYTSPDTILTSLRSIHNFKGAVGTYSFSDVGGDRYLQPTVYVKQIEGGEIKTVE